MTFMGCGLPWKYLNLSITFFFSTTRWKNIFSIYQPNYLELKCWCFAGVFRAFNEIEEHFSKINVILIKLSNRENGSIKEITCGMTKVVSVTFYTRHDCLEWPWLHKQYLNKWKETNFFLNVKFNSGSHILPICKNKSRLLL